MDEKEKKIIWDKILKVLPNPECPMCHNREFSIIDSYSLIPVIEDYRHISGLMKKSVPAICIICTRCGFLSQHALGALGLLEKDNEEKKETPQVKSKDNLQ